MHVEVLRQPVDVRVVVPVDAGVAVEDERAELELVHQAAREGVPARHLLDAELQRSLSASQSAVSGRYLYGMLLQTWLPSS